MPYSYEVIQSVKNSPKNLGGQLGRWAIHREFPVIKIARATGATRQTVYNWFAGGEVFTAYKPAVEALVKILQAAPNADAAWKKACEVFEIQN